MGRYYSDISIKFIVIYMSYIELCGTTLFYDSPCTFTSASNN